MSETATGIPRSTLPQEIEKADKLTVGQLREAMKDAPDNMPVIFHLGDEAVTLQPDDWWIYTSQPETFCIQFSDKQFSYRRLK